MSAPTILFVLGWLQSTVPVGDRVWSLVSWFDLSALPCFLRSFPGPFWAGVPGRLVPVGSGCASRRRAVSRVFAYPGQRHGVRVGGSALPGLSVGETVRRRLETEVSAPVREVGRSRQAGAVPPRPDLSVSDWTALLACCLDSWANP